MNGPLVIGKDLQLHPHQHEPVVRQIQHGFHQGGADPLILKLCVYQHTQGAHVAHPGVGADLEPGGADDGAVLQHRHEDVVAGAKTLKAVYAVLNPLGGEAQGGLKDAGHPPQDVEARSVAKLHGTDGIVHVKASPGIRMRAILQSST